MRGRIRNILTEAVAFEDRPNINDAFWQWFGNSVAVDEQGVPLVMYRGAKHDEGDAFEKNADFIYLTPLLAYAKNYTYRGEAKNISPYYVKMEHPLDMRKFGDGRNRKKDLYAFLEDHGVDVSELKRLYNIRSKPDGSWEEIPLTDKEIDKALSYKDTFVWELFGENGMKQRVVDAGYDGLIWEEKLTNYESGKNRYAVAYIVPDPRQIKSIYNRGTWDNSPDVTK